jgi:(2Fe-2S) ferredoxin
MHQIMSYYQHHIFFCTNDRDDGRPSCGQCGSELRDYAKKKIKSLGLNGAGKVRVNNAGCLDRCDEGPTMVVYPEGVWYHCANQADVDEIIASHVQGGMVVERLRM